MLLVVTLCTYAQQAYMFGRIGLCMYEDIVGQAWWHIAKSKLSNELEHRGIYLRNEVWDIHNIDI